LSRVLVIAPHPDDETLGCGGTLLKHREQGDVISWLIATSINEKSGWDIEVVNKRNQEIDLVANKYGFISKHQFDIDSTQLDIVPKGQLIAQLSSINNKVNPEIIYIPFYNDVHTDHQVLVKAIQSNLKWFRYPHIKKVLMYETPSETEFNFIEKGFNPNVFVDVSKYIDKKIEIMRLYESEMGEFPFPRSEETIRALATFRGSQSGFQAAEAFQLVFERI